MKKIALMLLLACAYPVFALPETGVATLTADHALLKEPKIDIKAMHECQPAKGDKVKVLEVRKNYEGLMFDVAHVRVSDGKCAGKEGWVGIARLDFAKP